MAKTSLTPAVGHLPFGICHPVFVICHLSSAICHLPSAICHLPSAICHSSCDACHAGSKNRSAQPGQIGHDSTHHSPRTRRSTTGRHAEGARSLREAR